MKKIFICLFLFLIPCTAFSDNWRVHWSSISATTQDAAPSLYTNMTSGKQDTGGAKIPKGTKNISVTCFTVGANATATDFNLLYDNQLKNGFELCGDVGANSSCGSPVTVAGHHLRLSADNDDAADAVQPYCEITVQQ